MISNKRLVWIHCRETAESAGATLEVVHPQRRASRVRRRVLIKKLSPAKPGRPAPEREFVVIGAGMYGLYQLHKLLQIGADVTVLERGDDVGGTWYWNRYPGCRFDSERSEEHTSELQS